MERFEDLFATRRSVLLRLAGCLVSLVGLSACSSSGHVARQPYRYRFRHGRSAILRGRRAIAPNTAPLEVQRMVVAGNRLHGLPYKWGGGHGRLEDDGYDCSGMVCYVLNHAGLLKGTKNSSGLKSFGNPGPGQWVTIYAKDGHAFVVVADLRLDTGGGQDRATTGPRWTTASRRADGFHLRHPPGL